MKITFLVPPPLEKNKIPERIYGCSYQIYSQPEMPILYVASILESSGREIELKDFTIENNSWESFRDSIQSSKSDAYIMHSVLLSRKIDTKAYEIIRQNNTKAYILFFGPEPTRIPESYAFDEKCIIIRGEPEITTKNVIEKIEKNMPFDDIKGISFLKNKNIQNNETFGIIKELDALPFPARHLTKKYENKFYNTKIPQQPHTVILTSRGCAHRCYFCVPNAVSWSRELEWRKYHNNQKPPLTLRGADNIIEEFRQLKKEGYKSVWVMDDMFLWGKERVLKILKTLKEIGGLQFGILARVDYIDREICEALSEAGCKIVDLGVESFDQKVLNYIKKDIKSEDIEPAVENIKRCGMIPEINLMMGVSPIETKQDIKNSVKRAIGLDVKYVLFSIATPFPGTELEKKAKEEKWIMEERYQNLVKNLDPANKAIMNLPNLSTSDLEKLERYAKLKFYFRPSYVWWQLKKVRSFSQLSMLIKTAWKIIKSK